MISDPRPGTGCERGDEDDHADEAERVRALERLRAELRAAERMLDDTEEGLRGRRGEPPSPTSGG
jgi:hypothetical protein